MRDRRDIRARREGGGTIRGIAREIGADRNSIRRALADGAGLDYSRPSLADEYEPAVRDVLTDFPRISVTQVAEIIEWPASRRALSDLVARLRPFAIERSVEALAEPLIGAVRVGMVAAGAVSMGKLKVGGLSGSSEAFLHSLRPARTARPRRATGLA